MHHGPGKVNQGDEGIDRPDHPPALQVQAPKHHKQTGKKDLPSPQLKGRNEQHTEERSPQSCSRRYQKKGKSHLQDVNQIGQSHDREIRHGKRPRSQQLWIQGGQSGHFLAGQQESEPISKSTLLCDGISQVFRFVIGSVKTLLQASVKERDQHNVLETGQEQLSWLGLPDGEKRQENQAQKFQIKMIVVEGEMIADHDGE